MAKSDAFASSSKERFQLGEAKQVNLSVGGSFKASPLEDVPLSDGDSTDEQL
jgi:hypothetical protein